MKLNEGSGGTVTASLRYIEFPLLFRFAASVGTHSAYLIAGPTFALKAGTSAQLVGPNQTTDESIDAAIRTFDAGFAVGGGLVYDRYLVEARYTQGLVDIATDVIPHPDGLKNRTFALLAGVRLK